ncbi:hypothetical protein [Paenibacillus sp. y28]|uniref:hypothetical protein n=1 Tax=Paenibacillus sp. y28 TaxID=3129110 RepID=UPI003017B0A4
MPGHTAIDQTLLELAIQTVLFQHRHELGSLSAQDNVHLLRKMAKEIIQRAQTFDTITDSVIKKVEAVQNGLQVNGSGSAEQLLQLRIFQS